MSFVIDSQDCSRFRALVNCHTSENPATMDGVLTPACLITVDIVPRFRAPVNRLVRHTASHHIHCDSHHPRNAPCPRNRPTPLPRTRPFIHHAPNRRHRTRRRSRSVLRNCRQVAGCRHDPGAGDGGRDGDGAKGVELS